MSVDERLADWLEQTTPEPPHPIAVADVAARVQRRRRRWQPLLAAACVLLLAAIALVVATRPTKHDAAPPSHRTSEHPRPTPTSPTPTTSTTSAQAPKLPIRPWAARIKSTWRTPGELTSNGTSLYLTTFTSGHISIYRLDTRSGYALDEYQPRGSVVDEVAFGEGKVWIAVKAKRSVHVEGLDPITLDSRERLPPVPISAGGFVSLAIAGTRIYLAIDDRVSAFDTVTRSVARVYVVHTPHRISGLAVRGDRVYVGTGAGEGSGDLLTYDSSTGDLLNTVPNLGAISAITATNGGLWVTTSSGMSAEVTFNERFVQPGGGGIEPTVGVFGNTAWLGGTGNIQCADADTGVVRARASTQTREASEFFTDLVVASGHVFARTGGSGNMYIVELHPPAACR
jgi:hypothetical protein